MFRRRQLFRVLKEKGTDIALLQQTHLTQEALSLWQSEWGGKIFVSNGESNARGVAILTKRNFKYGVYQVVQDHEGRYISCKLVDKCTNDEIIVANIYAPNYDNPEFFIKVFERIENNMIVSKKLLVEILTLLWIRILIESAHHKHMLNLVIL